MAQRFNTNPATSSSFKIKSLSIVLVTFLIGFLSCQSDNGAVPRDIDTDGDGITDDTELQNGTDKDDPCDPQQNPGFTGYDSNNAKWGLADCDGDGINNADELANATDPYTDDTVYPVPEFLPQLSDLKLFDGVLADLVFQRTVHKYELSTPLFTDYSYKLRSVALPKGTQMEYDGDGLLLFPDNAILTKTFYYLNDERDPGLGRKIIETRLLIKKNGIWTVGNYIWNDEQTEAFLDDASSVVQINWIDNTGSDRTINYRVPSMNNCVLCHDKNDTPIPIGPKARALNFDVNGTNQLQQFIDDQLLTGVSDVAQVASLPDWSDTNSSLEDRARAYMDVNCAHCHQPGGSYNINNGDTFEFRYETSFADTHINDQKASIQDRISTQIPNYFMPYIGTTTIHTEGVSLINDYIDSLQ